MSTSQSIAGNPKDAVANYILELETDYYRWYARKQRRAEKRWEFLQTLTVVAGFGTSIIAALMQEKYFAGLGWGRILLVVLPSIGSVASFLLSQTRLLESKALRERGRETIQYLTSTARTKYASISEPQQFAQLHEWLINEVRQLEQSQSKEFIALVPKQLQQEKNITTS